MNTTTPAFELEVDRLIDAPRARVYAAWTEPEQIKKWFAPKPYTLLVKSMDFRPGGRFEMSMRGPGGEDFPFSGTYREVDPPAKLTWTGEFPDMPKDSITTVVTFTEEGGKTRVRARQTFSVLSPTAKHAAAGAKQGWGMTMDQLVEVAERDTEIVTTRLIDAPVARVWRAWTDNAEIVKWWGPHGFSDETTAREFKEGGIWRHVMIGPDGTRYLNTAKYLEIVPQKKIVVKNGGGKEFDEKGVGFVATITFKAIGNKTELTMRSELITPEMKKRAVEEFGAIEGAEQTLSRLNAHCTGQFVIFRLVDAARERVWRAWTDPKEMGAWFGPKGSETTHSDLDFRVGGSYHYAMKSAGVEMWGLATYREIEKPAKLVYVQQFSDKDRGLGAHPLAPTWPKRMLTTVLLQDFGPRTLISLYWAPLDPTASESETFAKGMDGMRGGWGGSFDRLDALLKEGN